MQKGHDVVILDHCDHEENLAELRERATIIKGDIRDRETVQRAMQGCEAVFHQAAIASVPASIDDPVLAHDVNVNGTVTILEVARALEVRRIVFASTSAAYGDFPQQPKSETMQPWSVSPYAASKTACESYLQSYAAAFGMETVSLRYFNIFGPRQSTKGEYAGVIPAFLSRMLRGEQPFINGDGEISRDLCYVENVCQANWLAANIPADRCNGLPINIACGRTVTLNQIFNALKELLHFDLQPEYRPPRHGDILHSSADISLAREVLGYEPAIFLEEGLALAIEWYKANIG